MEKLTTLFFLAALVTACSPGGVEPVLNSTTPLDASPTAERIDSSTAPVLPLSPTPAPKTETPTQLPIPSFNVTATQPFSKTTQPQMWVTKAIDELSERLGIARDAVRVVEVNFTELTPEDLRCIPGNSGIQVPMIVFGYEIILQAGGKLYRYVGHNHQVIYCPNDF